MCLCNAKYDRPQFLHQVQHDNEHINEYFSRDFQLPSDPVLQFQAQCTKSVLKVKDKCLRPHEMYFLRIFVQCKYQLMSS